MPGDQSWDAELRQLADRGVWDPAGDPTGSDRALLVAMLDQGASVDELVRHKADLGDVATDLAMRPRAGMVSLADAASAADVSLDEALVVWRALGFSERDVHQPSLTPGEARLLALHRDMAPFLGPEATLQILRTMSTGLARLAQAERDALRIGFEVGEVRAGAAYVDIMAEYWRIVDEVLPRIDDALAAVHRRQIAMAARQSWSTDEAGTTATAELAVGFADLVGFTERSSTMTTTELAQAVSAFDALAHDVVHEHGGSVVKLIGDEVMFSADDPATAARVALALAAHEGAAALLPPLRVGVAFGQVITRDGDYFGPIVNLASRFVDEAGPGEVWVSEGMAAAMPDSAALEALAPLKVKGFAEPQPAWRVVRA